MTGITRTIPDVVVDFDEMAEALASAFSSEQVIFFQAFAKEVNRRMDAGRWPMQCRYITDEAGWEPHTRKILISQLENLVEHLKYPAALTQPVNTGRLNTLTGIAQLMDAWKQTAPDEWTEWDEELRKQLTELIKADWHAFNGSQVIDIACIKECRVGSDADEAIRAMGDAIAQARAVNTGTSAEEAAEEIYDDAYHPGDDICPFDKQKAATIIQRAIDSAAPKVGDVERLRETLVWAEQNLQEINPSNYDHEDVCFLNAKSVEVALGIRDALAPGADKAPNVNNEKIDA